MKIITLQLAAELGEFDKNVQKADNLLKDIDADDVDLLVLPELAFSGYNFESLEHIRLYLEPTAAGPSTAWAKRTARRLDCVVTVGYPEIATGSSQNKEPRTLNLDERERETSLVERPAKHYNSTVTVSSSEEILMHYRKSFLYYTDETWAAEGDGFYYGTLPLRLPSGIDQPLSTSAGTATDLSEALPTCRVAHGICMDLNPYKFTAPWEKYEFATFVQENDSQLVVMSNAWLTAPPSLTLDIPEDEDETPVTQPDMHTLSYWIERFKPLLEQDNRETVIICANRTGREGNARYAGTSTVMRLGSGRGALWGVLGKVQEGLLRVDTREEPLFKLMLSREEDNQTSN